MLGTGLGFGELGGVRIVVMEKRTFIKEMADCVDEDVGDDPLDVPQQVLRFPCINESCACYVIVSK